MSDRTPWIVVVTGADCFRCLRCGDSHDVQLPMSVTDWCKRSEAFIRRHRTCKEAGP